jgi:hypothetical protein
MAELSDITAFGFNSGKSNTAEALVRYTKIEV